MDNNIYEIIIYGPHEFLLGKPFKMNGKNHGTTGPKIASTISNSRITNYFGCTQIAQYSGWNT